MSVNDNKNKTLQDGNGTQTTFEFSFKIFKATDLKVYKIDKETGEAGEPLSLNNDYTVTINKVGEGGTVIFSIAPTENEQAGIYRDIEIIQPANIPVDTEYVEKTLENALDRACMIDQQLQEQIDRCIGIPAFAGTSSGESGGSFDNVNTDLPYPEAENVLAWNKDGSGLENYDVKKDIRDFESEVNSQMANFQGQVNTSLSESRTEFNNRISKFESEVNQEISSFETSINKTISEVTEAAGKINELEEAVQTAVDKADVATQKANEAELSATNATTQADRAESIAEEMKEKYEGIEKFKNSFPAVVNLTTWATLNDGKIYNIPFDDVKADINRFIQFENTDDRRSLRFKKNTFIRLETENDVRHLTLWDDLVIKAEEYLDDGETLQNGKDYSIFLVPDGDTGIAIKISLNKTAPIGFDTYNTRRIGGFHTECVNVGTISENHPMNGWLAGDIIPSSVWTLWHRPIIASPSGAYYIESRDAWSTIYSQSGTMENTVFEYGGTTTRSRSAWDHEVDLGLTGWEFPTSIDFTMSELGVIPLKAVKGKAESSCTKAGGWVNENDIRMVNNYGGESCCGGLWIILQEYGPCGGSNWANSGVNTLTTPRQWGSINRLLGGGNWDDSGYAGPSSRTGAHSALSTSAGVSARGWSRPLRPRQ